MLGNERRTEETKEPRATGEDDGKKQEIHGPAERSKM